MEVFILTFFVPLTLISDYHTEVVRANKLSITAVHDSH